MKDVGSIGGPSFGHEAENMGGNLLTARLRYEKVNDIHLDGENIKATVQVEGSVFVQVTLLGKEPRKENQQWLGLLLHTFTFTLLRRGRLMEGEILRW